MPNHCIICYKISTFTKTLISFVLITKRQLSAKRAFNQVFSQTLSTSLLSVYWVDFELIRRTRLRMTSSVVSVIKCLIQSIILWLRVTNERNGSALKTTALYVWSTLMRRKSETRFARIVWSERSIDTHWTQPFNQTSLIFVKHNDNWDLLSIEQSLVALKKLDSLFDSSKANNYLCLRSKRNLCIIPDITLYVCLCFLLDEWALHESGCSRGLPIVWLLPIDSVQQFEWSNFFKIFHYA